MITLKNAFERLMNGLYRISPNEPPPVAFRHMLEQHLEEFTVKNRKALINQGEIPKFLYFQISGTTHLKYLDENGKLHVTRFYRESRIILRKSLLLQERSPCSIVACKGSLMFRLSYENMKLMFEAMPGMREFMMRTILEYDNDKERMREEMLSKSVIDRVRDFYALFPMLLPAATARLDLEIAAYLQISKVCLMQNRKKLRL